MIGNLRETTRKNAEQDWLNSNLARFSGHAAGPARPADGLAADHVRADAARRRRSTAPSSCSRGDDGDEPELRLIATLRLQGSARRRNRFKLGEALVGQAALERKSILVTRAARRLHPHHLRARRGDAGRTIVVMPVLFEDQVLAVIELASLRALQRRAADLPRPALRDDRRRPEHDRGDDAHRGAARAVAVAHPGAAEPVRGAPGPAGGAEAARTPSSRRRRRRSRPPRSCSSSSRRSCSRRTRSWRRRRAQLAEQNRASRSRTRRSSSRARRSRRRPSSSRSRRVQVRVPRQHVARAAHAAQLAADPREAALATTRTRTSPTSRSSSRARSTARAATCST